METPHRTPVYGGRMKPHYTALTATPCTGRVELLDHLRGYAIMLMILDHAVIVFGGPEWIRDLTRVALPLFMVTAGYLFTRPLLTSRYTDVIFALMMSLPAVWALEIAVVPILAVFALMLPVLLLPVHLLPAAAAAGLLQAHNVPIPWGGYQPGYVLAFLCLGQLFRMVPHTVLVDTKPRFSPEFIGWIGQIPLWMYVGHLWLLVWLKEVLG